MSYFKINPNFKLYYSDTDNIVINKPLPEKLIGKELGLMKLEHVINKAVFLAPKVYGIIEESGWPEALEIIKAKGITKELIENIHINDLEVLLIKDSSKEFSARGCPSRGDKINCCQL